MLSKMEKLELSLPIIMCTIIDDVLLYQALRIFKYNVMLNERKITLKHTKRMMAFYHLLNIHKGFQSSVCPYNITMTR